MPKKNIIEINMNNIKKYENIFREIIVYAIKTDGIEIKDNDVYLTGENEIYKIDSNIFFLIMKPNFENVYKIIKSKLLPENINRGSITILYEWTNPFFDQLPGKIISKEECLNDFTNRLNTNTEYYNIVKRFAYEEIQEMEISRRKMYIDRMISLGILTDKDKVDLGYYLDYSKDQILELFDNGVINEADKSKIVLQNIQLERQKENEKNNRKKNKYNYRVVNLVNLLSCEKIIELFVFGDLKEEEFVSTRVTKNDLLKIPYEILIGFLNENNKNLPSKLKITSRDLVNEYGKLYDGKVIYKLAMYGYIEPQDLIEVYEINKALRIIENEDKILSEEKLREYYSSQILLQMEEKGTLSQDFIQKYLIMQDFDNNQDRFKESSQNIVNSIIENEKNIKIVKDKVLYFFTIGFCNLESAREIVSEGDIEEKFINNELTITDIFELYKKGFISDGEIKKYYENEEILDFYERGELDGNCLKAINDVDFLIQGLVDKKILVEDILNLYLKYDRLTISDLDDGLQLADINLEFLNFIDENVPFIKIKELFTNYLIDFSSLIVLNKQNIINEEQFLEIKNAIDTQKFFDDLKDGKKYTVVTTRQGTSSQKKKPITPRQNDESNFVDEINLISMILGKDVLKEPYSLIESYNSNGKVTSLNNYRIFGNEELDGLVILQKSKKENAVYVMTALQMMYFLRGKENIDGDIEIQNRMKDKAFLKTLEGVEVIEHTEFFARNLVEAVAKISPEYAKIVKREDGKYIEEVETIIEKMRQNYLETKEERYGK